MNAALAPLVRNFSTFGYLFGINESRSVDWLPDQALKQVITSLVTTADCPHPDAWARYFLIHLRAEDWGTLIPLLHSEAWQHPVKAVIDRFTQLNPCPNQPLQTIHARLVAEAHHPDIAQFLNTPTLYGKDLLTAYLQKPCWYAAKQFYTTKLVGSSLHARHSLEDCFQILEEWVSQPQRLLKAFRFEQQETSVKTYAEKKLQGVLQKVIADTALDVCSNWSLLRYLSRKELLEALTAKGQTKPEIDHYCLLWDCFQEVYQTKQICQQQLPPPTEQQLEQMAQHYQHYRGQSEQPVAEGLAVCIQAVRAYRNPKAVLERAWQHSSEVFHDPLTELIYQEEIHQVRTLLEHCLWDLTDEVRAIFYLWFGLELSLPKILEIVGTSAGLQNLQQLLRQIKYHRKHLLTSLLKKLFQQYPDYCGDQSEKHSISQQVLIALDDVLKRLCKHHLHKHLENQLHQLNSQQRLILSLRYQEQRSMLDIEKCLESSGIELHLECDHIMRDLVGSLQQWLEIHPKIPVSYSNKIEDHLSEFIHEWLTESTMFELGGKSQLC
jgi:hypothetical protein